MSNESDALARQEATILATVPTPATATDNRGVERIIEPNPSGWKPAPVHPDPDEVERLKRIGGVLEEKKEERLASFATGSKSAGASTGAEEAKDALEGSGFGGGDESGGELDGPEEDVAAGPGQIRDEQGRTAVEQAEARTEELQKEGDSDKQQENQAKADAKAEAQQTPAKKAAAKRVADKPADKSS